MLTYVNLYVSILFEIVLWLLYFNDFITVLSILNDNCLSIVILVGIIVWLCMFMFMNWISLRKVCDANWMLCALGCVCVVMIKTPFTILYYCYTVIYILLPVLTWKACEYLSL